MSKYRYFLFCTDTENDLFGAIVNEILKQNTIVSMVISTKQNRLKFEITFVFFFMLVPENGKRTLHAHSDNIVLAMKRQPLPQRTGYSLPPSPLSPAATFDHELERTAVNIVQYNIKKMCRVSIIFRQE